MRIRLEPCTACSRHIRFDSADCPFCKAPLGDAFRSRPAPVPPPRRMNRFELATYRSRTVAYALATASCLAACSSSPAATEAPDGLPSTALPLPWGAVAGTCEPGTYLYGLETGPAGALCDGEPAYVLCDPTTQTYSEYDCTNPGEGWGLEDQGSSEADYGASSSASFESETESTTDATELGSSAYGASTADYDGPDAGTSTTSEPPGTTTASSNAAGSSGGSSSRGDAGS